MKTIETFKRSWFAMVLAALPVLATEAAADTFDGVDPAVLATYQRVLTANEIDQRCQVFDIRERASLMNLFSDLGGKVFDASATSAQIESRRSVVLMLQAILRDRIEQEFAAGGCATVLDGLAVIEPTLTHGRVVHEVKAILYY
jgi:hypothetical protein